MCRKVCVRGGDRGKGRDRMKGEEEREKRGRRRALRRWGVAGRQSKGCVLVRDCSDERRKWRRENASSLRCLCPRAVSSSV